MSDADRISWILYKKKQVLFEDYSNLKGNEMLEVLYASEKVFGSLREPVPVLLDFNNAIISHEFMNEIMRLGKKYDALIKKGATIGIAGPKKALRSIYLMYTDQKHKSRNCDTKEEALEFLVKPENDRVLKPVM